MEKETLYRFYKGEATSDEQRRLMEWLDADQENRRIFDRERGMYNALLLFAPEEKAARGRLLNWRRVTRYAVQAAAVVILAVGIGWGYVSYKERSWANLMTRVAAPEGQRIQHLGGEIPTVQLLEQRAARCVVSSACIAGEDQRFQSKFTSLFDGVANQTDRGGMRLSTAIFIKCSHFHYKPKARRRKASGSEMSMFQVKTTGFRKRGHCSCVAPARIWAREILPETVLGRLST